MGGASLSFFEWMQLLSSSGILCGGGAILKYVMTNDRRVTTLEVKLDSHLKGHEQ